MSKWNKKLEPRDSRITVWFTERELEALREEAKKAGVTSSRYVVGTVFGRYKPCPHV